MSICKVVAQFSQASLKRGSTLYPVGVGRGRWRAELTEEEEDSRAWKRRGDGREGLPQAIHRGNFISRNIKKKHHAAIKRLRKGGKKGEKYGKPRALASTFLCDIIVFLSFLHC